MVAQQDKWTKTSQCFTVLLFCIHVCD